MQDIRHILKIVDFGDSEQYSYYSVKPKKTNNSSLLTSINKDESNRCSISRSISNIKSLCLLNDFDFFFTLTLKTNRRNDIFYSTKLINDSIKYYCKHIAKLKYVYVFEKQKKGGIHIHGYFSGFNDLYINDNGHLSSKYFDSIGFQSFSFTDKINPFYLIKYISKDPIKELKHRYYRSRNLIKPKISYIHCNFNELCDLPFLFQSDYCKMITFDKNVDF